MINTFSESLAHLENFFQLNFLFSGLEVSSTMIFVSRILVFLLFGLSLIWAFYHVLIKVLDCLEAFLANVGRLPKTFFLLLILIIPLSSGSLGAQWIGYILLVSCLLGLALTAALMLVLWKYGVDQAVRLLDALRTRRHHAQAEPPEPAMPPENIVTAMPDPIEGSREQRAAPSFTSG